MDKAEYTRLKPTIERVKEYERLENAIELWEKFRSQVPSVEIILSSIDMAIDPKIKEVATEAIRRYIEDKIIEMHLEKERL